MSAAVMVVEDEAALREALCETLESAGFNSVPIATGCDALDLLAQENPDLVVSDIQMAQIDGMELLQRLKSARPDLPVLLMTAFGSIEQAVCAMREGAADYLVKPFEAEVLVGKVSNLLTGAQYWDEEFVAVDVRSQELLSIAKRVAASDVTVLITGESGTGKEVLARYIHLQSGRTDGPFVAINCAAIPENMLEAVLFGYEKGAYTGAHKACPGKFEQAQGGTLLLDEISEMALGLQAKLLRVLQEREVERLGGKGTIPLDVRIVATSNRDVSEAVAAGRFREDLYYRLNVFPLHLLPLRERVDDIVPIAERLVVRAARAQGKTGLPKLSDATRMYLRSSLWPGNVRELDNTLQRALVLQSGEVIDVAELEVGQPIPTAAPACLTASGAECFKDELKSQEHRLILEVLNDESGNRKAAAEKLGISARTLRYKLARMRDSGLAVPGGSA